MRIILLPFLLGKINFKKDFFTLYSKKQHIETAFIRSLEFPPELSTKQHLGTDFIRPLVLSSEFVAKYNFTFNPDLSVEKDNSVNITVSPEKIKSSLKKELKYSTNSLDSHTDLLWTILQYYLFYLCFLTLKDNF